LDIKRGNSFLDVGSGCGLMTALGAYLCGEHGHALGIDIIQEAVTLATQNVEKLKKKGLPLQNVLFEKRNIFLHDPKARKWDRIHCGASCSHKKKYILYELLNPGGILVTPVGSHLIKAVKDVNGFTKEYKILDVRYSELIMPTYEEIQESEKHHIFVPVKSISNDYFKMFNNQFLSDLSFVVQGKTLYAHKIILVSRCEYFSFFFNSGMRDSELSEIIINDYSYVAFAEFLRFIYTGNCNPNSSQVAIELLYLGDYYQMESLRALSEISLSQCLNLENSCSILEAAHLVQTGQLKRIVLDFMIENFDAISCTQSFRELPFDCIQEMLSVTVHKLNR